MQDKADFDRFDSIRDLSEFSSLSRRLGLEGDRLSLLRETSHRMHELCAQSAPAHSSRGGWAAAREDYRQAGPGGACTRSVEMATQAILEIDRTEESTALAAAKSWKQLDSFLDSFAQRDVAQLLPRARELRDQARQAEIAAMRAMPLDDLERFWRNDAELTAEMRALAQQRLIDDSRAERSFSGALRVYRVTGDVGHVKANQALARTTDDRRRLEEFAVTHTATRGRFFRVSVAGEHGKPSTSETSHAGLFALYSLTGSIPTRGTVAVQRAPDAPGQLSLGQYRVHLEVVLKVRVNLERRSGVLGNADQVAEREMMRRVSVLVRPPEMSGTASFDFGAVTSAQMQRGSAGGFDQEWIAEDPIVQATIVGVDVLSGDAK